MRSNTGDVGTNLDAVMNILNNTSADVYVFPELYITGYGADYRFLKDEVDVALDRMTLACCENDIAIAIGAPSYMEDSIRNSLYFITQNKRTRYDKLYLAKFGIYSEDAFEQGCRPAIAEFKNMKFGLSICYDIFFPEIFRFYALNGVDVNICASASAEPSREYFEKIAPARSLENVNYTIFINNIGKYGKTEMFGHSRLIGPLGDTISEADGKEDVRCVYVDKDVVENSRNIRRHLSDFRRDIDWNV